jgi:hypothetical protein
MYFMDLSEQCGYSVQAQIQLFKSIKPLFSNKLVFIVINKIDVARPEDLSPEMQAELQGLLKPGEIEMLQLSCNTQEGVQEVKNAACERLIAERVNQKLKAGTNMSGAIGGRLADVMARIHVAMPMDGQTRETFVPDAVKNRVKYDKNDPERRRLARDVEVENGGAGVFSVDMREGWQLKNPEWKYDKIPEVFDGKNVYDFVDPDIEAKLAALEEEEEKLEQEGYYDSDEDIEDEEEAEVLRKAELIRERQQLIRNEARMKKRLKNQAIIPRKAMKKGLSEFEDAMDSLGVDTTDMVERARSKSGPTRGRSLTRSRAGTEDPDAMDVDSLKTNRERLRSKSRAPTTNRLTDGMQDEGARSKAQRIARLNQKKMNRMARQGEADRHTKASLDRHLVSTTHSYLIYQILLLTNISPGCRKAWHWQDFPTIRAVLPLFDSFASQLFGFFLAGLSWGVHGVAASGSIGGGLKENRGRCPAACFGCHVYRLCDVAQKHTPLARTMTMKTKEDGIFIQETVRLVASSISLLCLVDRSLHNSNGSCILSKHHRVSVYLHCHLYRLGDSWPLYEEIFRCCPLCPHPWGTRPA